MERCPFCRVGVWVSLPAAAHVVELAGQRFAFELPGVACNRCLRGEISKSEQVRAAFEVAVAFARAGVVDPEVFRFQRKALGFSSGELAELLGVTLNTLSRWENKERPLDRNAALLVACMVLEQSEHPSKYHVLDALKKAQTPAEVTMRGDPYLFSLNPKEGEYIVGPGESKAIFQQAPEALELRSLVLSGELEHFLVTEIVIAGGSVLSNPVRATVLGAGQNVFPLDDYKLPRHCAVQVQVKNTSNEPRRISGQCSSYVQRADVGSRR